MYVQSRLDLNPIIDEMTSQFQIDPYTHIGGRIQVLENHKEALEKKMSIYKQDVHELEHKLISKDRELESTLEESNKIKHEKESIQLKLDQIKKKIMFTTEWLRFENDSELLKACATDGKAFSTRSYHSPSPVKKLKEIAIRKDFNWAISSKIEKNLLKFMLYLESKGLPVIKMYKDEFVAIREKKIIAQLDSKVKQIEWDLFQDDPDIFLNDHDYNNGLYLNTWYSRPLFHNKSDAKSKVNSRSNHIPRSNSETGKKQRGSSNFSGSSNNHDSSNGRLSFHSDDSFRPICKGKPILPEKPSCVPVLDLKNIEQYCDSDNDLLECEKNPNLAVPDYSNMPLYHGMNQIQNQL